jgi:lipopolysaccharide/colanic/teichoic acid biosynthesis glycosyltransferase
MNLTQRVDLTGEGEQSVNDGRLMNASAMPRPAATPASRGLPRSFDFLVSLIGIIFCAPVILISAFLVAVTSRGGAWFLQERVGLNGRVFILYKLRTMKEKGAGPQVTSAGDPRITWVGGFLRRTKLDELPTLWNVLRGDMALVGPRPEVPRYVDMDNPMWRAVVGTRPGITDPTTLKLRNEEKLLAAVKAETEK